MPFPFSNPAGDDILNKTVTPATFKGLPIIGTCGNRFDNDNPAAAANLFNFANSLDAPMIVTDNSFDGFLSLALQDALLHMSRLCVPGFSGLWLTSDGTSLLERAVCGPILSLESVLTKAKEISGLTLNLRRNHKFNLGCDAIWPAAGGFIDLAPHPPIYLNNILTFQPGLNPGDPTFTVDHYIWTAPPAGTLINGYFKLLWGAWNGIQPSIFNLKDGQATQKECAVFALDSLAPVEVFYVNSRRRINPALYPIINLTA